MNKSTSSIQFGAYQPYQIGSTAAPIPVQRLIVLIPNTDIDATELEQHIWQLAISTHSCVLLLGLSPDSSNQLNLRRQLVSMAAAIRDNNVSVEIRVEAGKSWDTILDGLWQTGDLVIGLEAKRNRQPLLPVDEIINSRPQIPIYTLSVMHPTKHAMLGFLKRAFLWSGLAGILAAFFWGQIQISRLPQNWGQTLLLIVSVIVEIIALLVWNATIT